MESHNKERDDAQRWTGTNLKTEGVMIVPQSNLMFVDIGHPVFEYSVDDADEASINRIKATPIIERHYKVYGDRFYARCDELALAYAF